MKAEVLESLLGLLQDALFDVASRGQKVSEFQRRVWDEQVGASSDPVVEVLKELAYDLDFYEGRPAIRAEDSGYYGNERFEAEVRAALGKLHDLGVDTLRTPS